MSDRLFTIPEGHPEANAFAEGLAYLRHEWPFEEINLTELEASAPGKTSGFADLREKKQPLKGYWTKYPTYCLIAYPTGHKKYTQKLDTLKLALTAAHLRLLQAIHESNKHYQSRLTTSFKAYRQLYEGRHDATLALLPSRVTTLAGYENALSDLVEEHVENQTLHDIHRALEGAIEGSGGYTRHVSADDAETIVGENTTQIYDDYTSGKLIQKRKKVNNEQITTRNRLARDESATGPVLYQPDRSISPESGESMRRAIYQAKGQKASQMRLNQLLAFDWTRLSLIDVSRWFNNLDFACKAVSAHHDVQSEELKALCSLMFWTGRAVKSICHMLVVRDFSRLPQSTLGQGYIIHDSKFTVFPKLQPAGAKQVSSNWQAYVRVSADRIFIPLPSAAREHIRPWLNKQVPPGKKGKKLFNHSNEEFVVEIFEDAIDALINYIHKNYEPHLTETRLVSQIPIALANQCGDSVRAAAALGVTVGNRTTMGLYYYTATQHELAQTYWKASSTLSNFLTHSSSKPEPFPTFPPSTMAYYVGTNVCPDNGEKINQEHGFYYHHVQDLRNAIAYCRSRAHKSDFTVAFHNAYVAYCVAMLGAITGYRAVKDPLNDIRELDEATGFVVISDKDFDDHRNARLTWAPPVLRTQLQAYARYRAALVRCLRLENDLPFFFFLNNKRHTREVTPNSLADNLGWSSELPPNANRHYLRTRLTEKGVPGEIIDAFMGHWDIGEEPYSPYSAISPAEFKAAIAPALEEIVVEQGWQVEHVVSSALASDISPAEHTDAKPMYRKQVQSTTKAATAKNKDREREEDLFLDAKARLESADKRSETSANNMLDDLFEGLRTDPELHDWRFVHNRLVQHLADAKRENGWSIEVPSPIVMFSRTPAPFTPELFRGLAELRPIERFFIDSIRELNPEKLDIHDITSAYAAPIRKRRLSWTPNLSTFLVGQILFAAARYGGLLSRKALEDLLNQLPSGGMVIRDHLIFDLTLGAFTRRWYADPLSCSLILRYRWLVEQQKIQASSRSVDDALKIMIVGLVGKSSRLEKLSDFLKSASVAWRLNQPGYLYQWADRASTSCSWDQDTEIRVRFDRRISAPPEDESDQKPELAEADLRVYVAKQTEQNQHADRRCDLNRAYQTFYNCLKGEDKKKSWRGQITQNIEAWLKENRTRVGPFPTLVAQWALAIIRRQVPEHQGISASSSLRTYVSCIGRTLFIESMGIDIEHLDNIDTYISLYQSVVDSKRQPSERSKAAARCQAFHNFVVRRMDAPTLSVGETVGTGPTSIGTTVNANYITPFELKRAFRLLWQNSDRDLDHWIAAHVLELGYWSGLRISELLGLRLRDIDIAWTTGAEPIRVEILCRGHSQRSLKTATSRRRIPVLYLMPQKALKRFVSFVMHRSRNQDTIHGKDTKLLFSKSEIYHEPTEEQTIRNLSQSALRKVTGDNTLVFHHLRHSAANNMLMALMARSGDDPIWDLFPRKPYALLDVSQRINRGLMINTDRRRGILHAVATLLGHTEPNVTLQSYIHILPWIDVTRRRALDRDEFYTGLERNGLERDVALDSSLLAKSENATRSWRSRHNNKYDLQSIADNWLNKFEKNALPTAYTYSEAHSPTTSQELTVPPRPLPSFDTIYLAAQLFYKIEMPLARRCSNAELSRIASQTAIPDWLIGRLRDEMAYASRLPALRPDVSANRKRHGNRYQSTLGKFMRGHGPIDTSKLDQHPELAGLIPAPPHTKAELNDCWEAWNGLSNLLDETGRWAKLTEGTHPQPNREAEKLLSRGLRIFLARANSSDSTIKFFNSKFGLDDARSYVAFVKRIYPKNKILVELKPPKKLSEKEALAAARKDLELTSCKLRSIQSTSIDSVNWPYGIPSVRLLTKPGDINNQKTLKNSRGPWFAQLCFALLYRAICHE